jgi:putative ABC transport system permease protein
MTLGLMVWRSLRQHALSTGVAAVSIALAGGLLMAIWVTRHQTQRAFAETTGFDGVLGARGSKLQLVLNSVFHLEASPGNLTWEDYQEIRNHPAVELAVPLAVGDNYRGYRLVGTTLEQFERAEASPGQSYSVQPGGRWFDPLRREAVVGSFVASRLGLELGDTFHPFHGLAFDEEHEHAETYLVVGVLQPSNTPADTVIWVPLAGIQKMSGHDQAAASDISAVLVKLRGGSAVAGFQLDQFYNRQGDRLTFAWPIGRIVAQLFGKIAWFDRVLTLIAGLVALVAAASILASLYNSMNERRRDLAILRALGAHRRTVFGVTLMEAVSIAELGMILSFAVHFLILHSVAAVLRAQTGVVIDAWSWHPVLVWTPLALVGLGALAGLLPAFKAYRTDVADNLAPLS